MKRHTTATIIALTIAVAIISGVIPGHAIAGGRLTDTEEAAIMASEKAHRAKMSCYESAVAVLDDGKLSADAIAEIVVRKMCYDEAIADTRAYEEKNGHIGERLERYMKIWEQDGLKFEFEFAKIIKARRDKEKEQAGR